MNMVFTRHTTAKAAAFAAAMTFSACAQAPQPDAPNSVQSSATPSAALVVANPPVIKTAAPVIYLADNMDEPDQHGWCIDTKGRDLTEDLHVHTCKPAGGDVQFLYDGASGQIRSATYDNKCAILRDADAAVRFGLTDCDAGIAAQKFEYDSTVLEISPRGDRAQCLSSGTTTRSAGPWVARDLNLTPCESTAHRLKQWVVISD